MRNLAAQAATANVTFNLGKWAYPGAQWLQLTNLLDGGSLTINLAAGTNSVPLTLQTNECRVYGVQAGPPPRPAILMNDGNFGFRSNQFAFNVSAMPGQVVVVQAATNLANWTDLQTNTHFWHGPFLLRRPQFARACPAILPRQGAIASFPEQSHNRSSRPARAQWQQTSSLGRCRVRNEKSPIRPFAPCTRGVHRMHKGCTSFSSVGIH